ncbi:hypothetical protein [Agromyces humi]|uniref:hypothetical protein n=1 Tax=Agromyces humi TaxID=1766800 RepID=UPI0013567657|nr:hypothetical protein [Agromyces humi]
MEDEADRHKVQEQVPVADAQPPIVIYGDGLCEVYLTVAAACQALEAVDVNDGLYEAFDCTGRALLLVTKQHAVSIDVPPNSAAEPAALARRLRDYIQVVGADRVGIADLVDASLSVMLDALLSFQRRKARKSSLYGRLGCSRISDPER